MSNETVRYHYDCERIVNVVKEHTEGKIQLTAMEAQSAWEEYSDLLCAGWLCLPTSDSDLYICVRPYLERCTHCGTVRGKR